MIEAILSKISFINYSINNLCCKRKKNTYNGEVSQNFFNIIDNFLKSTESKKIINPKKDISLFDFFIHSAVYYQKTNVNNYVKEKYKNIDQDYLDDCLRTVKIIDQMCKISECCKNLKKRLFYFFVKIFSTKNINPTYCRKVQYFGCLDDMKKLSQQFFNHITEHLCIQPTKESYIEISIDSDEDDTRIITKEEVYLAISIFISSNLSLEEYHEFHKQKNSDYNAKKLSNDMGNFINKYCNGNKNFSKAKMSLEKLEKTINDFKFLKEKQNSNSNTQNFMKNQNNKNYPEESKKNK